MRNAGRYGKRGRKRCPFHVPGRSVRSTGIEAYGYKQVRATGLAGGCDVTKLETREADDWACHGKVHVTWTL